MERGGQWDYCSIDPRADFHYPWAIGRYWIQAHPPTPWCCGVHPYSTPGDRVSGGAAAALYLSRFSQTQRYTYILVSFRGEGVVRVKSGITVEIPARRKSHNFSFQGRGNKYKFEALKTWDLIQGALLLHFEADSLAAAEKVASSWLANAKWRQQSDGTSLRQSSTSKD